MTCDHDATKASLTAFLSATTFRGFQVFADGEVHLLANCNGCESTIAVAVELPRGRVVHGEIEAADARARAVPGQDVLETMEQHAARIIR